MKITIGVPAFNGSLTLLETLRCIQNQHYKDFEVIVSIDDGDHGSYDVVHDFLTDSRFHCIVQNERLGWAGNISRLIEYSKSNFFCYWQQDDLASHNYLSELLKIHENYPDTSVAYTDVQFFGDDSRREHLNSIDEGTARDRVLSYMDEQHWIPLRGLIRSKYLLKIPSFAKLCSDSPFENGFLSYLAGCAPLRRCQNAIYFKRSHANQWSSSFGKRSLEKRRRDWIVRASVILDAIDSFSSTSLAVKNTDLIVNRFANPPNGRFADYRYEGFNPSKQFCRDALAIDYDRWSLRLASWDRLSRANSHTDAVYASHLAHEKTIGKDIVWSMNQSAGTPGESFLGFGWSFLEPWGVWSDVYYPTMLLPKVDRHCWLQLHVVHYGLSGQSAKVIWYTDNRREGVQEITCSNPVTIRIPIDPTQRKLYLYLPDAVSPKQLGSSSDFRILGLGIMQISVTLN